MSDPHDEVDLQGVARLIGGEGIGPERQAKIHAIGQKLGVRTDDPMFAMLVLLEVHAALFSGVPDRMAAAAKEAAADVGEAARETTRQVIAETVTETVDQRAFARRFRIWSVGTVVGTMLINCGFGYADYRLLNHVGVSAEAAYREESAKGKEEIEAAWKATLKVTTEAATKAALTASQDTAKSVADRMAATMSDAINLQVAEGLKIGKANANEVALLLSQEYQHPGMLKNLVALASSGWQAVVKANPSGICGTTSYDQDSQKKTCTIWAP